MCVTEIKGDGYGTFLAPSQRASLAFSPAALAPRLSQKTGGRWLQEGRQGQSLLWKALVLRAGRLSPGGGRAERSRCAQTAVTQGLRTRG